MPLRRVVCPLLAVAFMTALVVACVHMPTYAPQNPAVKNEMHSGEYRDAVSDYREKLFKEGGQIFRHDTFGSEDFWSGKLRLHQAIAGERFGGVGHGLEPKDALKLGLKVDTGVLPKILGE